MSKTIRSFSCVGLRRPRVEKNNTPYASDAEVEELVALFASCRLPYARWTHRAHLAVAVVYVRRYSVPDALEHIREGIRQYNESRGDTTGYHETITALFYRMVVTMPPTDESLAALVNRLAVEWPMSRLLNYYSPELLWSDVARDEWVEPDKQPLDF